MSSEPKAVAWRYFVPGDPGYWRVTAYQTGTVGEEPLYAAPVAGEAAQPAAVVSEETYSNDGTSDIIKPNLPIGTKLYTAPPAPAAVPVDAKALFEAWVRDWHEYPEQANKRLASGGWGSGYDDEEIQHKFVGFCAGLAAQPAAPQGVDLADEVARLNAIINSPQSDDFIRAVSTEAEHQRQRWGSDSDAGKTPADWFWLVGYLAGKALHAHAAGDAEKAEHHVITTAAACANWHRAMFGRTDMRPGIDSQHQQQESH